MPTRSPLDETTGSPPDLWRYAAVPFLCRSLPRRGVVAEERLELLAEAGGPRWSLLSERQPPALETMELTKEISTGFRQLTLGFCEGIAEHGEHLFDQVLTADGH